MNWFKSATNLDWQGKEFYHLANVMKFEIDSFPDLSIDEYRGELKPDKIGFYIIKDDGKEYYFVLQKTGDDIRTNIITKPLQVIGSDTYNISQYTPQQIIESGLIIINNNFGEGTNNELV